MRNFIVSLILVVIFSLSICFCQHTSRRPPIAKINNVVDEYFGVNVNDHYRYMENLDDPEVQKWIKGQAEYADEILSNITVRDEIYERLQELDAGKPFRIFRITRLEDGRLFYMKLTAGQNIAKLYVRYTNGSEKLLVDPEKIKPEDANQHFSISSYSISPSGKFVVYGLAKSGSEETILHIMEVESGKKLPEMIDNIETAYNKPRWIPDGSGFFYCRRRNLSKDAPETEIYKKTKVYFHKLHTEPNIDNIILGTGISNRVQFDEIDFPSIYIPSNSKYAIAKIKHGDANEIAIYTVPIISLLEKDIPWENVCGFDDEVHSYAVHGNNVYLRTAKNAPRFKVVKTSIAKPDFSKAEVVIQRSDLVVDRIYSAKDALYIELIDGGFNRIARLEYSENAKSKILDIPNDAAGFVVSISQKMNGILVYTNSWIKGSLIYQYNPESNKFSDSGLMPKGKYDDLHGFTSKEVKVKSHDGVMVPLSIIHKSDIKLDGSNPTLILGYGGYGISIPVFYNPLNVAWFERGGVFAIAHVRGGGEYGKEWHLAGQKLNKPNTWKDFIACSEYLIDEGYTTKELIAGQGGSAGGIMIGRAITERPDLFAAAIINVGSLDAIRFETTTNGVPNIPEFGTVKREDGFKGLLAMSSYHHVKDGVKYPAILLTHGINDPRVEPWESAKMTARLQAASASRKPVLFRVDYSAGHGIGSTREQYLRESADTYAFLFWQFGLL